jgi:uncharacterized protein
MRRRPLLLLPALLAACASPPVNMYTLAEVPGAEVPTARHAIQLRRVGLPGSLDRSEIVRAAVNYQLQMNDRDRWGGSLGAMIGLVLSEDLAQRLPQTTVFTETGAVSTDADIILEIDIARFDGDASGTMVLLVQVGIRHNGTRAPPTVRTLRLTQLLSGPTTADQVATMSALLGQLADAIARAIGEDRTGAR